MRYAILSDVHDNQLALEQVLADARLYQAEAILCLGDVGSDTCLDQLRQAGAEMVFGNWEVSQWGNLRPDNQHWVRLMPPLIATDTFLAVHAVPWWPEGLNNVEDFLTFILQQGVKWRQLFPYLDQDEQAFGRAVAELEQSGRRILFHGHTHLQLAHRAGPTGRVSRLQRAMFTLDHRAHYVVGVGSVGRPEDDPAAKYALYNSQTGQVQLRSLG